MKKAANEIALISIILCITILLGRIRSKRKFGSSGIAGNASNILCRHCAKALQPFSSSRQNWLNGLPVERQFMIFFRKPPDFPLNCLADLVHARLQKVSRHQVFVCLYLPKSTILIFDQEETDMTKLRLSYATAKLHPKLRPSLQIILVSIFFIQMITPGIWG